MVNNRKSTGLRSSVDFLSIKQIAKPIFDLKFSFNL